MTCNTGSCDLDSGIISCEDYQCLANLYSQARDRQLDANQDLLDAVYQIIMLNGCIVKIDLLESFWNSYNLSTAQSASTTFLLDAVRSLNRHVLNRGNYDEIDDYFSECHEAGTPVVISGLGGPLAIEIEMEEEEPIEMGEIFLAAEDMDEEPITTSDMDEVSISATTTTDTPIIVDTTWQSLSSEVGFDIDDIYVASWPDTIKAYHVGYYPNQGDTPENSDVFVDDGFNTLIVHGLQTDLQDTTVMWNSIRDYTAWAKSRNMMFFPTVSFSYDVTKYGRGFEQGWDEWGHQSNHVSPWSVEYWDYLGDFLVELVTLVKDSDEYRADGVFMDHEIYGEDVTHVLLRRTAWGYADGIWQQYLDSIGSVAVVPQNGTDRRDWLSANTSLDEYYLFLEDNIQALSNNVRERVKAIDPSFVIGVYQKPRRNYYDAPIASGYSTTSEPIIVWGTEMYIPYASQIEAGTIGVDLLPELIPYGTYNNMTYYAMENLYGKPIYGFYVGGFVPNAYSFEARTTTSPPEQPLPLESFNYHNYEVGNQSSGYWCDGGIAINQTYDWLMTYLYPLSPDWMYKCAGLVGWPGGVECPDESSYNARIEEYRESYRDVNSRLP
jgi:hypothetical protein